MGNQEIPGGPGRVVTFQDSRVSCGKWLIVSSEFDFAAVFPTEDDTLVIDDNELAGDEARVDELLLGNLAFAFAGAQAGSPGGSAGRDVIVTGNFNGLEVVTALMDANDFIEMSRIVSYPLTC